MSGAVKLSEAASIALHATTLLAARADEHVSVKDLATRLPVSEGHLAKVLQRLVKTGLVTSVRGPSGGFRLAADPERTTLLEIYEAIEGKLEVAECMFSRRPQSCGACILDDALAEANRIVHARLARTRLSQLAGTFAPAADPPLVALARRKPAERRSPRRG
jgi:Rrf2 family protein